MKRIQTEFKKFHEVLFVSRKIDRDSEWLQADAVATNCMEDDGPEIVASYRLTGAHKLQKVVRTVELVNAKGTVI